MQLLMRTWQRVRSFFGRDRLERELEEEIELHLEMKREEHLERGVTSEEAARAARRQFGNAVLVREVSREMWTFQWVETVLQDLRYGVRMMRRNPGFAATAIVLIALGIGANTVAFSLIDAALLRPLDAPEPERLARVFSGRAGSNAYGRTSWPNYLELRKRAAALGQLAAFSWPTPFSLGGSGGSPGERVWGAVVSSNYFDILAVAPALGRTFLPDEEQPGAPLVVILSHRLWQRRFGGDPALVGRTVRLNSRGFLVAGIMPDRLPQPDLLFRADLWVPMGSQAAAMPGQEHKSGGRTETWLSLLARLPANGTLAGARAELAVLAPRLESEYPRENRRLTLTVLSERDGRARRIPGLAPMGWVLFAVTGFVVLIACANVASLLIARNLARRREIAIRLSLGAARSRVVRQLLTETLVLWCAGAVAGMPLAIWGIDLLLALRPPTPIDLSLDARIDARVLLFALLLTAATALVFGLAPGLRSARAEISPSLASVDLRAAGAAGRSGARNVLVTGQIALSITLLVAAGLFARSLSRADAIELGFGVDGRFLATVDLGLAGYTAESGKDFHRRLLGSVGALPGVRSVSSTAHPPLAGGYLGDGRVYIAGERPIPDELRPVVYYDSVGPRYFATMGTPLRSGRDFDERDDDRAPRVAVVNETFARSFWGTEDPIGKRLRLNSLENTPITIVGVAGDGKYQSLGEPAQRHLYLPSLQSYTPSITIVVHTSGDPSSAMAELRGAVAALDRDLSVVALKTMREHLGFTLYGPRTAAALLGAFAGLGLVLALVGLAGVLAFAVRQRRREIAVRVALGARPTDAIGLVLRQALRLTAAGTALGLALAAAASRLLSGLLYGIHPLDVPTFAGVAALFLAVALAASLVPAQAAARVDPMEVLHDE